jgi:hypothetical protein
METKRSAHPTVALAVVVEVATTTVTGDLLVNVEAGVEQPPPSAEAKPKRASK